MLVPGEELNDSVSWKIDFSLGGGRGNNHLDALRIFFGVPYKIMRTVKILSYCCRGVSGVWLTQPGLRSARFVLPLSLS